MSCRKSSTYFIFLSYLILSTENVSVYYQWKTDLNYQRQANAVSVPVVSLPACALKCAAKVRCVFFFFNILEFLCQTEGRIRLSFNSSDAGPWLYYEMKTVNAAFNKTAWMSTIYPPSKPYYVVDGEVVLDGHAGQCSHTLAEYNPWIAIDLGAIYIIKYVTLVNRIDDHGEKLHDAFVSLGETDSVFPVECGQYKGPGLDAEVVHVICPNNTRGRFVKTELRGPTLNEVVVLCEIRVLIS